MYNHVLFLANTFKNNIPIQNLVKSRKNYMKIIMRFKITFGLIVRTSTTAASIQFADQNRINFFANIHGLRMRNLLFYGNDLYFIRRTKDF